MKDIFPQRLTKLIKSKNVKVADMSDNLGISKKSIYNFMKGAIYPSAETLSKIADYLGVSIDYLVGRVNVPTDIILMEEKDEIKKEIFFIREAYHKMDEAERRIIHNVIENIIKEKERKTTEERSGDGNEAD
ncbi:helix-turn-helix domain-containing protein [Desulfallas sp. Bu1-1]|uniref:helix-turn-helix domain-containing protein n=1 Tax=Desulfallas sp. Bu1-1 TaxID=2787620 RepID=UPI00189FD211|nr:helix-turn-helix domain-containing protein [Desulfallas sp. Bu1-1]MBF7083387.1 helix-turn-helix domain-containing protein [Desulfallas sp. Bu1-1]